MDYAQESLKKHYEWKGKLEITLNCPPCQGHFLKWGSLFFLLFCLYPVLRYPVFYHYGIL